LDPQLYQPFKWLTSKTEGVERVGDEGKKVEGRGLGIEDKRIEDRGKRTAD